MLLVAVCAVRHEIGVKYYVISVGIGRMKNGKFPNFTDLLIDGLFSGESITVIEGYDYYDNGEEH